MAMMNTGYKTVDAYIAAFPQETQRALRAIRALLVDIVPSGIESINYGIPTLKLHGKNLVHYAGYTKHIGFYPGSEAITVFAHKLKGYVTGKGTVQFKLTDEIPHNLIKQMTQYRIKMVNKQVQK